MILPQPHPWSITFKEPTLNHEIAYHYSTLLSVITVTILPLVQPWITQFNTLRPRQNGRHFADDMFKCIFVNENVWIPIEISLKFVPEGSINNNPALFQIMAWRRPGDKPLSEPMMVSSLTHICVTRSLWVKPQTLIVNVDRLNYVILLLSYRPLTLVH